MSAAHLLPLSLLFPLQNVPWVAGENLDDIHDVKAVSLLLAMKQNLWKLLMGGLSSSSLLQILALAWQRKRAQRCNPGICLLRLGCCSEKMILKPGDTLKY